MTSETRYFRSDQQTINGLTAYKLLTSNTTSYLSKATIIHGQGYIGIRVWKRNIDGNETEITAGVPVALAFVTTVLSQRVGTWSCPQTSLNLTDAVVVRVYACLSDGSNALLIETFITEQLGATQLDSATWTVYYWARLVSLEEETFMVFYWGSSTYNSRIENFTWTIAVAQPQGDGITFVI